jgi:DNA-binding MarR family transcriptional regulator
MAGLGEPNDVISHRLTLLLHRLVGALIEGSAPQFRSDGLSIPAARVLVSLLEEGGSATVGAVSLATSIDLSTTSHILRRLERQELVRRERQVADNRVVVAVLTTQGVDVARRCRQASLNHEALLTKGMSTEEVVIFKRLLIEAFNNAKAGFELS